MHKCPIQQKDQHGNGLPGHVKRRKVSLLHYDKSARHVIICGYFGIWFDYFMVLANYVTHSLQNFEKITRRVQSKNKDQVFAVRFSSDSYLVLWKSWLSSLVNIVWCTFCRLGIITIDLWDVWTSCLVQGCVWMPRTLKILMLQCFDGNINN